MSVLVFEVQPSSTPILKGAGRDDLVPRALASGSSLNGTAGFRNSGTVEKVGVSLFYVADYGSYGYRFVFQSTLYISLRALDGEGFSHFFWGQVAICFYPEGEVFLCGV